MSNNKEEPRVGVFVCRCGLNVAKSVDTTSLKEFASKLPGVVYTEESDFACTLTKSEAIDRIAEAQRAFQDKRHIGKIVLVPPSPA